MRSKFIQVIIADFLFLFKKSSARSPMFCKNITRSMWHVAMAGKAGRNLAVLLQLGTLTFEWWHLIFPRSVRENKSTVVFGVGKKQNWKRPLKEDTLFEQLQPRNTSSLPPAPSSPLLPDQFVQNKPKKTSFLPFIFPSQGFSTSPISGFDRPARARCIFWCLLYLHIRI